MILLFVGKVDSKCSLCSSAGTYALSLSKRCVADVEGSIGVGMYRGTLATSRVQKSFCQHSLRLLQMLMHPGLLSRPDMYQWVSEQRHCFLKIYGSRLN